MHLLSTLKSNSYKHTRMVNVTRYLPQSSLEQLNIDPPISETLDWASKNRLLLLVKQQHMIGLVILISAGLSCNILKWVSKTIGRVLGNGSSQPSSWSRTFSWGWSANRVFIPINTPVCFALKECNNLKAVLEDKFHLVLLFGALLYSTISCWIDFFVKLTWNHQ